MADPRKAGEEADRMIAELSKQKTVDVQPAEPVAITPIEPVTPDVNVPPVTIPQVNPEIESLKKQVEVANQQWRVLQGMINKKDEDLDVMRNLLAKVSDSKATPAPAKVETVSEAELKEYGPELVELITRIARQIAAEQTSQMVPRFEELQKSVKGVSEHSQKTAADLFDESLAKRIADWKEVNVAPAFMTWLQVMDEFSGRTRLDLLNDAYSRMDLERTARFFEAYKGVAPAAAAPDPVDPVAAKVVPITPPRSKSGSTPPANDDKLIWTQAMIQKLYSDQRQNRISKEEFDKLERDLFKAQGENRLAA